MAEDELDPRDQTKKRRLCTPVCLASESLCAATGTTPQMTGPDNPTIDPVTKASNPLQEMNRIAAPTRNLFCRAAFGKCVKECLA
ncbi:hypothetical protein LJR235_003658 [Pararhizobium sp. LjRoot235]|uniref:hypothetical protein n=1 Tax=Pararhizobium sp. LjRoot235 TaxID=3342291 RepID=UPI003ED0BA77